MTRRLFADDPNVLLRDASGYLRIGAQITVLVTTDAAGLLPADLIVGGVGRPDGTLIADTVGQLPDFYGPDGDPFGVDQLYARIGGGYAGKLYARANAAVGTTSGFDFVQATPASTWTVDHAMPRRPGVTVIVGTRLTVVPIDYPSATRVVATFPSPVTGRLIGS